MFNTLQLSLRLLSRPIFPRLEKLQTTIRKQNGTGWAHRRPIAVINEKIEFDGDADEEKSKSRLKPRKSVGEDLEHRPMREKICHRPPTMAPTIDSDKTYNEDGTLRINKFTQNENKLSALIMELRSRKKREKKKLILLEGYRLIQDAIKAGLVPETIFFSRMSDVEKLDLPKKGVKVYKVPYATLQIWSSLTTSPGLFGIFKHPDSLQKESNADTLPLTIICDNVREPGNMGSIIRAAAGVGCEKIIMTKGCVDVWETKVLRSAVGAHFRVSIMKSVEQDEIESLISSAAKIYVADNNGASGSEGASGSPRTTNQCDSTEANFQKSLAQDPEESSAQPDSSDFSPPEKNSSKSVEKDCEGYEYDKNFEVHISSSEDAMKNSPEVQALIAKEILLQVPVVPYWAPDYTQNEVVLIVGGETEGLSFETVELVKKHEGVRVNIPLTNEVESLNTGMALGIVAFEVRQQFEVRKQSATK